MKALVIVVLALALLIGTASAADVTVIFLPSQDGALSSNIDYGTWDDGAWATLHDRLAATKNYNTSDFSSTALRSLSAGWWNNMDKSYFTFDTSSIPDGKVVKSAKLHTLAHFGYVQFPDYPNITLTKFNPADPLLVDLPDFQRTENTELSEQYNISTMPETGDVDANFTIYADKLNVINKTGYTSLTIRFTNETENIEILPHENQRNSIWFYWSRHAEEAKRPYLEVTYGDAEAPGTGGSTGGLVAIIAGALTLGGIALMAYGGISIVLMFTSGNGAMGRGEVVGAGSGNPAIAGASIMLGAVMLLIGYYAVGILASAAGV